MTTLNVQAITETGCCVYISVEVSTDYTMNEVVEDIKDRGFKFFRLETMKCFSEVR